MLLEPESTLVSALARAARSDRLVRFVDRHEQASSYSYRALQRGARSVAGGLLSQGLVPGDRVAIVLPTGVSFYEALFGAMLAGLVPVPLYPPLRLGRMDEYHVRAAAMIEAAGARLVLSDARVGQLLGRTVTRARPDLGYVAIEALPRQDCEPAKVQPDDLAIVQFSSGTTVAPKPVRLTHRNILTNVAAILGPIVRAYPEEAGFVHRGVSWLPLYHDMGLVGCLMVAVAHPGELVLIPPEVFVSKPAIWLRTISRYRGTISPAPHFAYALCVDRIRDEELSGVDLSCWRVALDGAEPVTAEVLSRFAERFSRHGFRADALTPVYGLAEATLAVTFSDLGRPFHARQFDRQALTCEGKVRELRAENQACDGHGGHWPSRSEVVLPQAALSLVSVGRPVSGCEVKIVGREGQLLAEGQLGSVLVRGASVMQGYHDASSGCAATLQSDGWLDTGDSGFWWYDELYLYGRTKDLIVIRGRNIAPQDVEQALDGVPGVRTGCSAAIGVLDAHGEQLVLLVERARRGPEGAVAAAELERRISRSVTTHTSLVPTRVVVLEPGTLPRTSSGKIRRAEARRQYLVGALKPPKAVTSWRIAFEVVRSRISLATGGR